MEVLRWVTIHSLVTIHICYWWLFRNFKAAIHSLSNNLLYAICALHHHPHKPWDILYFWTKFIVWSIHNFAYIYVYKSHALHHHLHKHWDNLYFLTKSIVWCQFIILLILVQYTSLVVIIINVSKIHSLGKHF